TKEVRMTTTFAYPEAPAEHGRGGRVEGELKVSGQLMYADDLALPGLLYVAAVRSPYPHARIVSTNTEQARKVPGVHLVLTGADGRPRGAMVLCGGSTGPRSTGEPDRPCHVNLRR